MQENRSNDIDSQEMQTSSLEEDRISALKFLDEEGTEEEESEEKSERVDENPEDDLVLDKSDNQPKPLDMESVEQVKDTLPTDITYEDVLNDLEANDIDEDEINKLIDEARLQVEQIGVSDSYKGQIVGEKQLEIFNQTLAAEAEIKKDILVQNNILEIQNLKEYLTLQSMLTGVPIDKLINALKDKGEITEKEVYSLDDLYANEDDDFIPNDIIQDIEVDLPKGDYHKGPLQFSEIVFSADGILRCNDDTNLKSVTDLNQLLKEDDLSANIDLTKEDDSELEEQTPEFADDEEELEFADEAEEELTQEPVCEAEQELTDEAEQKSAVPVDNPNAKDTQLVFEEGLVVTRKHKKQTEEDKISLSEELLEVNPSDSQQACSDASVEEDEQFKVGKLGKLNSDKSKEINTGETYSLKDLKNLDRNITI